jgi:hypothetical protein
MSPEYLLECLRDGQWHDVSCVLRRMDRSEACVLPLLKFCAHFDLIVYNSAQRQVRIDQRMLDLFAD